MILGTSKIQGGSKGQLVTWPGIPLVFHARQKKKLQAPKWEQMDQWNYTA